MNILGIIPARSSSKEILCKNIQKLNNKPLLAYSIVAAKKSKLVNRVIVSTDDQKIASIAKNFGAEVPFLRPKKLSQDTTPTLDVIIHSLNYLSKYESYKPNIVTLLQPTTPLRTENEIDSSIKLLKKTKSDIVLGVQKIKTHPFRAFWLKRKYLKPFKTNFLKYHQRQKFPIYYYPTGSIYTFWYKNLKKYDHIYGPKIYPLILDNEINIDIDKLFDLFIAEMKIKNWNSYKNKFRKKVL